MLVVILFDSRMTEIIIFTRNIINTLFAFNLFDTVYGLFSTCYYDFVSEK